MEFEFEEKPRSENGREKMSQETGTGNLVDTTDCLEAVSVIKCWKNLLFIIILLGLLLLQGSFWMVNLNLAAGDSAIAANPTAGFPPNVRPTSEANPPGPTAAKKIKEAAKQVAAEPNAPPEPNQPAPVELKILLQPKLKHITALVLFLNFILIPSAMLYCLTMLFSLKVSLIGRLGGINHIARAFFLSLLFVVLLLPWQLLFTPVFAGAMFTPDELIKACQAQKTMLAFVSFYLRFTGYWLLVLLLLLAAQIRSMRWAKATLRRLEVV
jgi:hypothetical protein